MAEDQLRDRIRLENESECPYGCPVCAGIALMRQMQPDVTSHLSAAAREFVMAAKSFLESMGDPRGDEDSPLERIPLD